jgi:molybdate transport system substrate-binding protein
MGRPGLGGGSKTGKKRRTQRMIMRKAMCFIAVFVLLQLSAFAAEITMGAGAGLKDVLNDISAEYVRRNPDVKITKNFAASGTLAKQIESGFPLDIVLVANTEWMDYLREKKLVKVRTVMPFAYNGLVFVGIGGKRAEVIEDIVKLDKIAIGSPKMVPAGEYALEAIRSAGIEKQLGNKLVMTRDVRECLVYAERGEVDGAFVYRTDALLSSIVTTWFIVPEKYHRRVVYMSALTLSGAENGDASRFYSFLLSGEGKKWLRKYGFEVR